MDRTEKRDVVVLAVDDDADLLQFEVALLEAAGHRVITASDGRKALRVIEVLKPDVIVLDMMMPELDGLGFLSEYVTRPTPRAPVIAVSGFTPYLREARSLGAAATLTKPFNPRQLISLVGGLAEGKQPELPSISHEVAEDDLQRLRALFEVKLDEPAPEPGMQRFLDEIAALFEVPVAAISAVTADRERLTTHCTMIADDPGTEREHSFCTHAVAARAALVIQDARDNPFFRDNPNVTVRGFRFYAGVPLVAARGEAIGTLCILDFKPHSFTHFDLELLGLFGRRVHAALEWRHKRRHPETPASVYSNLQQFDDELDIYARPLFRDLLVVQTSRSVLRGEPAALVVASVPTEHLADAVDALRGAARGGLIGRLGTDRLGAVIVAAHAREAEATVKRACGPGAVTASTDLDRYQGGASGFALVLLEQALDARIRTEAEAVSASSSESQPHPSH